MADICNLGPLHMPVLAPTWTNERIELLKQHFEAGLSCREIAADIGVSRNAVIGKLSRLNLTRGRTIDDRKVHDGGLAPARAPRTVPRLQYEMLATIYGETGAPMVTGPIDEANRCSLLELAETRNLSREDAYTLCSLAADLRVTQTVNGSKGIHCMIEKAIVHG